MTEFWPYPKPSRIKRALWRTLDWLDRYWLLLLSVVLMICAALIVGCASLREHPQLLSNTYKLIRLVPPLTANEPEPFYRRMAGPEWNQ